MVGDNSGLVTAWPSVLVGSTVLADDQGQCTLADVQAASAASSAAAEAAASSLASAAAALEGLFGSAGAAPTPDVFQAFVALTAVGTPTYSQVVGIIVQLCNWVITGGAVPASPGGSDAQ